MEKLANARLVTTGRDCGPETPQVGLAHEALINGWHRLGEWVNENRQRSRLKERLVDSAREWQRNQKREDFLYRGVQLAAAEESFRSSAESLPKLGREFLEASISMRDHDRQERQREQRNRQRLMATAVVVFALLAAAAGAAAIFGFWQKGEAEKEARVAIEAERKAKEQANLAQAAKGQASEAAPQTCEWYPAG